MTRARIAAVAAALALAAGCATHRAARVTRIPDHDPDVARAMSYARALLRTTEPAPVRWYSKPGTCQAPDGMWCHEMSHDGRLAGALTQYLPDYTRIVVYTGPNGERALTDVVFRHEAVHAVGRDIIQGDHPERTTTGIRLRGVVPYW